MVYESAVGRCGPRAARAAVRAGAEGGRGWPKPDERGRIVGWNRAAAMHRLERAHGLAVSLVSLVRRPRLVLSRFSVIANRHGAAALGFSKTRALPRPDVPPLSAAVTTASRRTCEHFPPAEVSDSMNSLPA